MKKYDFLFFGGKVLNKFGMHNIQRKVNVLAHEVVLKRIYNAISLSTIKKITSTNNQSLDNTEKKIWICWWQGVEKAPFIVKKCIDSIVRNAGDAEVFVVTSTNYKQYTNLNESITKKFYEGKIPLIHFSDIIRFNLLLNNGGIWIDASIFVTKPIPEKYFLTSFISRKDTFDNYIANVSERKWSTYFIGGKRGLAFFELMNNMYIDYWEKNNRLLTYFLTDYFMKIAYDNNICDFKDFVDNLKFNNSKMNLLEPILNKEFSVIKWDQLLTSETLMFKLTYKREHISYSSRGKLTFYGKIFENEEN